MHYYTPYLHNCQAKMQILFNLSHFYAIYMHNLIFLHNFYAKNSKSPIIFINIYKLILLYNILQMIQVNFFE